MKPVTFAAQRIIKQLRVLPVTVLFSACGSSIYAPVAPESSDKSMLEKAILALDARDFGSARDTLQKIWESDKSNNVTQLYANSILGAAGFDLYEIIVRILKSVDGTKVKTANDLLDALTDVLDVEASEEQLNDLELALDVLDRAQNQSSASLEFQKCLTVGIYALPVINGVSAAVERVGQTLDELPAKLEVSSADRRTCLASTDTIASIGQDLTDTIAEIGLISQRISEINGIIQNCSTISSSGADATQSVNKITTRVENIISQADKGCTVPQTGALGSRFLPSCMTAFIEETAKETVANDGAVSGCEIFTNCSRENCFSR